MWNLCRSAALQQLARRAAPSSGASAVMKVAAAAAASAHQQHGPLTARAFHAQGPAAQSSSSSATLSEFLEITSSPLKSKQERKRLHEMQAALDRELDELLRDGAADVDTVRQFVAAGRQPGGKSLLVRGVDYLLAHHPEEVDTLMLSELFRALVQANDLDKMWAVYEQARAGPFAAQCPEVLYRYGITALLHRNDVDGALGIVEEMKASGVPVSNDIYSRLIQHFARADGADAKDKALEYLAQVDPQRGPWFESSVNRVILSLGVINEPQMAFDFYVNSNVKLSGGTMITLLSVCRNNDCINEASDILANRKRFNLALDARGYNSILVTLEFLNRREEIADVLDEMGELGVRYDTLTKLIVRRNQDVLQGTYYEAAGDDKKDQNKKTKKKTKDSASDRAPRRPTMAVSLEIRELLKADKLADALALADTHVRPLTPADLPEAERETTAIPDGALRVAGLIAGDVAAAYIANDEHAKVDGLLGGFKLTRTKSQHALGKIFSHYSYAKHGRRELAYDAARLMVDRGFPIYRADVASLLFCEFKDGEAAVEVCRGAIRAFAGLAPTQQDGDSDTDETVSDKPKDKAPRFKVSDDTMNRMLGWTATLLAEQHELEEALSLVDEAHAAGVPLDSRTHLLVLNAMRLHGAYTNKGKGVVVLSNDYHQLPFYYTSNDFEAVLDQITRLEIPLTHGHLANAAPALAAGTKRQRLRLLEAYAALREAPVDEKYTPPVAFYSILMQLTGKESASVEELQQVYEDGLASLKSDRVPRDWMVIMATHLAELGHLDEAIEVIHEMPTKAGSYSYEALMMVLRACAKAQHGAYAKALVQLLEERDFKLTLQDAYDLVHLAKDAEMPHLAYDVILLYERAHGRSSEELADQAKTHQTVRDKFALRKIRSMYRAALLLCEQSGEWKLALSFNNKVSELGGFEDGEAAMKLQQEAKEQEEAVKDEDKSEQEK